MASSDSDCSDSEIQHGATAEPSTIADKQIPSLLDKLKSPALSGQVGLVEEV